MPKSKQLEIFKALAARGVRTAEESVVKMISTLDTESLLGSIKDKIMAEASKDLKFLALQIEARYGNRETQNAVMRIIESQEKPDTQLIERQKGVMKWYHFFSGRK